MCGTEHCLTVHYPLFLSYSWSGLALSLLAQSKGWFWLLDSYSHYSGSIFSLVLLPFLARSTQSYDLGNTVL
jgi:hypothetical protein